MSPAVKHNTFVGRQHVDSISKMFIILTFLFGANRISVIESVTKNFFYLSLVYSFAVIGTVTGFGIFMLIGGIDIIFLTDIVKYTLICLIVIVLRERLHIFYKELDRFDEKIGYNVKITKNSIQNLFQLFLISIVSLFFIIVYLKEFMLNKTYIIFMLVFSPLTLLQCFELNYLAHLIGIFSPRIRLLSYHIKLSYPANDSNSAAFSDASFTKFKNEMKRKPKIEIGDLMDLYYSIIKAYDYLNEAIKWQFLVLLKTTFLISMGVAYRVSMQFITGDFNEVIFLANIFFILFDIFPMFTICFFADQVCREVVKLRDALSSSLYDNSLDKSTRTTAQAFLSLTEARDLSFSLFNMVNIGITLPFNFLSLLLTYLIILLQFQKVINPNVTA